MIARKLYIFLGAPGSGKGSLAAHCVQELGWYQLSTGNLCRYHIGARTPQGLEMDLAIKSGKLVSDDLIGGMVLDWLSHDTNNIPIILDGFPRTVIQAQLLDDFLNIRHAGRYLLTVVYFDIDDATVTDRIGARCVCSNKSCQAVYSCMPSSPNRPKRDMICDLCASPLVRRVDDTKEAIQERLAVYKKHATALLDFYREHNTSLVTLDAKRSAADVYNLFKAAVGISI